MNPLCTLRYSATHVDKHHMVYRLDAVDAYERKLVKQIEVASADSRGRAQQAYVRLAVGRATSAASSRRKVELDVQTATGVQRARSHRAGRRRPGADHRARDLRRLPHRRDPRRQGQRVPGTARPGGEQYLQPGQAWGDVDAAGRAARDDPPHHQGASGQGEAPAPAGHQGALSCSSSMRSSSTGSTTPTATR